MKPVTELMIKNFKIMKLGIDFAGYRVDRKQSLSFHHLIIPKRNSKQAGIGDGYVYWNGSILVQNTSHDYLHLIEKIDRDIFEYITNEMVKENQNGRIDKENLEKIKQALLTFEKEHENDKTKKGKLLIKAKYITNRIK